MYLSLFGFVRKYLCFVIGLYFLSIRSSFAEDKSVSIALLTFPPYSYENEKGEVVGSVVELERAAFEAMGYTVKFYLMPYRRAIESVKAGTVDACGILNSKTDPFITVSKSSVVAGQAYVSTRKSRDWRSKGVESLENKTVLTIDGYNYSNLDPDYQRYIDNNPKKVFSLNASDHASERALKILSAGRADAFAEDERVVQFYIEKLGVSDRVFRAGPLGVPFELNIGFKKSAEGEGLKSIFDQGMERLRMKQ